MGPLWLKQILLNMWFKYIMKLECSIHVTLFPRNNSNTNILFYARFVARKMNITWRFKISKRKCSFADPQKTIFRRKWINRWIAKCCRFRIPRKSRFASRVLVVVNTSQKMKDVDVVIIMLITLYSIYIVALTLHYGEYIVTLINPLRTEKSFTQSCVHVSYH